MSTIDDLEALSTSENEGCWDVATCDALRSARSITKRLRPRTHEQAVRPTPPSLSAEDGLMIENAESTNGESGS